MKRRRLAANYGYKDSPMRKSVSRETRRLMGGANFQLDLLPTLRAARQEAYAWARYYREKGYNTADSARTILWHKRRIKKYMTIVSYLTKAMEALNWSPSGKR